MYINSNQKYACGMSCRHSYTPHNYVASTYDLPCRYVCNVVCLGYFKKALDRMNHAISSTCQPGIIEKRYKIMASYIVIGRVPPNIHYINTYTACHSN